MRYSLLIFFFSIDQLDNLYTLENVGKGFAGGAAKQVAGKSEGDGADKKTNPPKSSTPREG